MATKKFLDIEGTRHLVESIPKIKIKVVIDNEELAGMDITCTNGVMTYTKRIPIVEPYIVTFVVNDGGDWTISSDEIETTVNITNIGTTEINFGNKLNLRGWLESGGLSATSFSTIEEVLADEKTTRRLMTIHASSDYLVEWVETDPEIIDKITNSKYGMKWIGLRDYICNKLMSIEDVTEKLFNSEYWEYILKDKVPKMYEEGKPYGNAIANGSWDGRYYPRYAFDGNVNTSWQPNNGSVLGNIWIGYIFTKPICVNAVSMSAGNESMNYFPKKYKVQGSNNGTTWVDLSPFEFVNNSNETGIETVNKFENDSYYTHIRVLPTEDFGGHPTGSGFCLIGSLQFYGRELSVSVPTMTSNTDPYGEAISSGYEGNYASWKVFRNTYATSDDGNYWQSDSASANHPWIGYDFGKPVVIKAHKQISAYSYVANGRNMKIAKIEASNDKVTWIDISGDINVSPSKANDISFNIFNNDISYRYWRVYQVDGYVGGTTLTQVQFYGFDYSEREFEPGSTIKYIYDHGLELETVNSGNCSSSYGTETKYDTRLELVGTSNTVSTAQRACQFYSNPIDLKNYSLARLKYSGENLRLSAIPRFGSMTIYQPAPLKGGDSGLAGVNLTLDKDYLDISSLNSTASVIVWVNGGNEILSVDEIWVE